MATVPPSSGAPSADIAPPRGPTYLLATRELSADFTQVGPEQIPRELGAVDAAQFLRLLEKLVAVDALALVDADPQLFVTVKTGRFLIQPQGGKLLIRPTNALDQIFFKLSPTEIPPFLDGAPPPRPPPAPTTLIGSAVARTESNPSPPAPARALAPAREPRRAFGLGILATVGLLAAGATWFLLVRTPAPDSRAIPVPTSKSSPPPAARAPEFDPIESPAQLTELRQQFGGTYVTSGDSGERLLELRADGTFHYQVFGSGLAVTSHDTGTYTFAVRHGTTTPVIQADALGPIEIRGENSLFVRGAVFTHLLVAAK